MKGGITLLFLVLTFFYGCAPNVTQVKSQRQISLHTDRGGKVFIAVYKTSPCQAFPLEDDLKTLIGNKGYTIVGEEEDANAALRVYVRFCGLVKDATIGAGTVGSLAGLDIEEPERKTTYLGYLDVEVIERDSPFPHLTTVKGIVRERDLTPEQTIGKLRLELARQIAGIF